MAHFARIDENNIVTEVIVAEQDVIDTGLFGHPSSLIKTSYNTFAGYHTQGKSPLRFNYAGIGYVYRKDLDAFIAPRPYPSWTLNESTKEWNAPVAYPDTTEMLQWDEETQSWI